MCILFMFHELTAYRRANLFPRHHYVQLELTHFLQNFMCATPNSNYIVLRHKGTLEHAIYNVIASNISISNESARK
jgi:hypothetical protein